MTGQRTLARPRGRWRQRWYRFVIPLVVLGALVIITLAARFLEEPNPLAGDTLSPSGTGRDGSSQLAQLLTDRGVAIDYVTDLDQALEAGQVGDSVVFIPKPTIFGAYLAGLVPYLPGQHRVVMVAPSAREVDLLPASVEVEQPRWASRATEPGCTVPETAAAGTAAALRGRYRVSDPDLVCYEGGLVRAPLGFASGAGTDLFVVGSTDPFRNRRIDEHGNAELAVELLAAHDRVIWAGALPFDVDFEMPEFGSPERPEVPELPEVDAPERRELDRSPGSAFDDMFWGYPPQVVAGLALLLLLAVLVALVRARRLGPPVSEPLPVLVPAAEAVAGRGRLYQRSRGRGAALAALRTAALRKLTPALGLPGGPPPEPDVVVAAVAARTGLPDDHIRHTLFGPEPETDEQLTRTVAALDALVEAVTREGGTP